jgi:hypothetical protein
MFTPQMPVDSTLLLLGGYRRERLLGPPGAPS